MLAVVATAPEQLLFTIWVVYQFCVKADGAEVLANQLQTAWGHLKDTAAQRCKLFFLEARGSQIFVFL